MSVNTGLDEKWCSKQRSAAQQTLRPRQLLIEKKQVDQLGYFDGYSANFIDLAYQRRKKRTKPPKLSSSKTELFHALMNDYKPQNPGYKPGTVTRRTLFPQAEHQLLYANKEKGRPYVEKEIRHKKMRCNQAGSEFVGIGLTHGAIPYIESNTRDIVVEYLKDGLDKESMKKVYTILREKKSQVTGDFNINANQYPLRNYLFHLRKDMRKTFRKYPIDTQGRTQAREKNVDIEKGSRLLYQTLYESEHRMLHIQAGGSYGDHISACQKRRALQEKVKKRECGSCPEFIVRPAQSGSHVNLNPTVGNVSAYSKMKEAALITVQAIAERRRKQLFHDKLKYVNILLSIMKQMKQPKLAALPIPAELMKAYRQKATAFTTAEVQEITGQIFGKTDRTKSRFSKRVTIAAAAKQHGQTAAPMKSSMKPARAASAPVLRKKSEFIRRDTLPSTRPSTRQGSRKVTNAEVHFIPNLAEGVFDPATITWEEFLQVGVKNCLPDIRDNSHLTAKGFDFANRYARLSKKEKARNLARALRPSLFKNVGKLTINQMWSLLRKTFRAQMRSSQAAVSPAELLNNKNTKPELNPLLRVFALDKLNPTEHFRLNWFRIKSRANNSLLKRLKQRERESMATYNIIKKADEITDSSKWKHRWSLDFALKRRMTSIRDEDVHLECIEKLKREAKARDVKDRLVIGQLLVKIQRLCNDPIIKHTTIYRGQLKLMQIVLSLPAFEVCSLELQSALQYVLVDVLHGEVELLIPMMKQRGLPLHPAILDNSKFSAVRPAVQKEEHVAGLNWKTKSRKSTDYRAVNEKLAVLPPSSAANSRNMLSRLENAAIYSSY